MNLCVDENGLYFTFCVDCQILKNPVLCFKVAKVDICLIRAEVSNFNYLAVTSQLVISIGDNSVVTKIHVFLQLFILYIYLYMVGPFLEHSDSF